MLRIVLAIVAGLVSAVAIMMACEYANSLLYPFPQGMDTLDAEQVRKFAATMPVQALLLVAIGWMAGSFAAGYVSTKIVAGSSAVPALFLACFLTVMGMLNAWMIQNPPWFHAGGLPIFVLFVMLGEYAARPRDA